MVYVKPKKKVGRKRIGTPEEARQRHLSDQRFSCYFRGSFYFSDNQYLLSDIKIELEQVTNADLYYWVSLAHQLYQENRLNYGEFQSIEWRLRQWDTIPIPEQYALHQIFVYDIGWCF